MKKPTTARVMRFQVYKDKGGEFRWRAIRNGRILADSGEGYASRQNAERAARRFIAIVENPTLTRITNRY